MAVISSGNDFELFQESFVAGRIFYLFCNFTNPPKNKFLVLACPTGKPLFLVINSEISAFISKRDHLRECQVVIHKEDHHCFSKAYSYVDCSEVIDKFTLQDVLDQCVNQDMGRIKEMITVEERNNIIAAIDKSETIIEIYKKRMLDGLTKDH